MRIYNYMISSLVGIIVSLPACCDGQSRFFFSNFASAEVNAPVFDATGAPLSGANYVAMLYGGPTPDFLAPARDANTLLRMDPSPFTRLPQGMAGYFRTLVVDITTVPCGAPAWLQVRAWDAQLGGSYEEVVQLNIGGYGESNIFFAEGADPCLVEPSPPTLLIGLESFSLRAVIPEPSPLLLLLLGSPLLLLRRFRTK